MTSQIEFSDKFIAFVDILGFSSKVEKAEKGEDLQLSDLIEFCSALAQRDYTNQIAESGPRICPESSCISPRLDYEVTQVSDCAVISAEVSPSGIVHLVQHVSACAFRLLRSGIMVRGYITRGRIFHKDNQFMGTGFQKAVIEEKAVGAFRWPLDDTATPFVEVDPAVVEYINQDTDKCVRDVFKMWSSTDENGIAAIFPFKRLIQLAEDFAFSDREKCRKNVEVVENWIYDFLHRLDMQVQRAERGANEKAKYYRLFLYEQLSECDKLKKDLDLLAQPAVRVTVPPTR